MKRKQEWGCSLFSRFIALSRLLIDPYVIVNRNEYRATRARLDGDDPGRNGSRCARRRRDVPNCSRTRASFSLSGILALKREQARGRVLDALSAIRAPASFANSRNRGSRESQRIINNQDVRRVDGMRVCIICCKVLRAKRIASPYRVEIFTIYRESDEIYKVSHVFYNIYNLFIFFTCYSRYSNSVKIWFDKLW